METSNSREPLTAEEKERFEGYAMAIFSRLGHESGLSGNARYPAEMAVGPMGYD